LDAAAQTTTTCAEYNAFFGVSATIASGVKPIRSRITLGLAWSRNSCATPWPWIGVVATTSNSAALIQWVPSGTHLSGTYDSVVEEYENGNYSALPSHCGIHGVDNGTAITVTLAACTDPSVDGTYFGRIHGSGLTLDVPTAPGAVEGTTFAPGQIRAYNLAVAATQLLVMQDNALTSYLTNLPPSQPCGETVPSPVFRTSQGSEIIVFRHTNTICSNNDSRAGFDILEWYGSGDLWLPITNLPFDAIGSPERFSPIALGAHIVALAVKEDNMLGPAYQVVADVGGHWRLVPFETPGLTPQQQSNDFAYNASTITPALTVVEHARICGQTSCSTKSFTLHYDPARVAFVP
jgi:hypothetical protein